MLHLTFKAGGSRFALPARMVDEVAPLVRLTPLPGAPEYVAGFMNHRGKALPVADMGVLLAGKPSRAWASTRIVVVAPAAGLLLGLMAERVLKTATFDQQDVTPPGAPAAPYIAGVTTYEGELVQLLDLTRVLPAELLARLTEAAGAAA